MVTGTGAGSVPVLPVRPQPYRVPPGLPARLVLAALCLVAAFAYRASVSLLPFGLVESSFLLCLAGALLGIALFLRRTETLLRYWEIPFAFFVFTLAGFAGDLNVSPLQRAFVSEVLHQAPTSHDPFASTVLGTVLVQAFCTLCLVAVIVVLIKASGDDLRSIYISKSQSWAVVAIGAIVLLVMYYLAARGRLAAFFPNHGMTTARFLDLTPALLVLVLLNGLREELWFRGLFLKRYQPFLGPWASIVLTAVIFTSFHVQVRYTPQLLTFLGYTFILGLILAFMMRRSDSMLGSILFHAGADIPIFLVYLSYVSS